MVGQFLVSIHSTISKIVFFQPWNALAFHSPWNAGYQYVCRRKKENRNITLAHTRASIFVRVPFGNIHTYFHPRKYYLPNGTITIQFELFCSASRAHRFIRFFSDSFNQTIHLPQTLAWWIYWNWRISEPKWKKNARETTTTTNEKGTIIDFKYEEKIENQFATL